MERINYEEKWVWVLSVYMLFHLWARKKNGKVLKTQEFCPLRQIKEYDYF